MQLRGITDRAFGAAEVPGDPQAPARVGGHGDGLLHDRRGDRERPLVAGSALNGAGAAVAIAKRSAHNGGNGPAEPGGRRHGIQR
jgi:hypothetical protein